MSIQEVIQRGNIVTKSKTSGDNVGRYLGNGRFGTVIDSTGLNRHPEKEKKNEGKSQYMHMKHWGRFSFRSECMGENTTADYILPVFRIYWETPEKYAGEYRQTQNFYDGVLETEFTWEVLGQKQEVKVTNWFDMVNKNVAGIRIELSNGLAPIRIAGIAETVPYPILWKNPVSQKLSSGTKGNNRYLKVLCKDAVNAPESIVYFQTMAEAELCEDGIRIIAKEGMTEILISYGEPVREDEVHCSLNRSRKRWHELWKKNGWFDFPEDNGQQMWVRSMAYLLCTYEDNIGMIQPTNGFTGNIFPFHFVQDMEYICPALLMTGHVEIVKKWVEKFAGMIDGMRRYAKKLWPKVQGIYPPWELPYGDIEGYHEPHVPIVYCYEPHNAGYLCRMAAEVSEYVNDEKWTQCFVHPLINEICLFYLSFCEKGPDGHYHFEIVPCVGQDEAGGRNKKDYLCIIYSARYCFQKAIEYGLDTIGYYERILKDDFVFDTLLSEEGICHTSPGADDFGKQKHPIQLNGLAYFPVEGEPMPWERRAYEQRYELTDGAKNPCFYGWTLGEFLLAGTNAGDVQGWLQDWNTIEASRYTDEQRVQIYESSRERYKAFYTTTHGLILQSLMRNYVNDYWGRLQIGSCCVWPEEVNFGNISVKCGVRVSGKIEGEKAELRLEAWKDCKFLLQEQPLCMKKGETVFCTIMGNHVSCTRQKKDGGV